MGIGIYTSQDASSRTLLPPPLVEEGRGRVEVGGERFPAPHPHPDPPPSRGKELDVPAGLPQSVFFFTGPSSPALLHRPFFTGRTSRQGSSAKFVVRRGPAGSQ